MATHAQASPLHATVSVWPATSLGAARNGDSAQAFCAMKRAGRFAQAVRAAGSGKRPAEASSLGVWMAVEMATAPAPSGLRAAWPMRHPGPLRYQFPI